MPASHTVVPVSPFSRRKPSATRVLVVLAAGAVLLPAARANAAAPCRPMVADFAVRELAFKEQSLNQAWAPDSQRIAIAQNGRVMVYDTRTDSAKAITEDVGAAAPTWSDDGRTIFFSSRPEGAGEGPHENIQRDEPPRLYRVGYDGGGLEEIHVAPEFHTPNTRFWDSNSPAKFSTDGRRVAFSTVRENLRWSIVAGRVVRRDGRLILTDRVVLNDDTYWNEVKGWQSPDVMYVGSSRGDGDGNPNFNPDVFTLDIRSGLFRRLTTHPAWEETASIADTHGVVAFQSDRENLSAGPAQLAPKPPGVADNVAVLTAVPLLSTDRDAHDLFVGVDGDRGAIRRLTHSGDPEHGGWAVRQPKWSPDGSRLRFQMRRGQADGSAQKATRSMLLTFDCRRPVTRITRAARRGKKLVIVGRSRDRAPRGVTPEVREVRVAVSRRAGRRCRHLGPGGRLTRARSCRRRIVTTAKTDGSWKVRLPLRRSTDERLRVVAWAIDASRNRGRADRRRV